MAFFEQLGKRLTDAGQNVAHQTKNLADVTQLNSAISEKEKKILQLFSNIGQLYYEMHKHDPSAENYEIIEEINSIYAEITQNREKIKQIKGVMKCTNCGADVAANAVFCNVCGSKIVQKINVVNENMSGRYCSICHAAIAEDDLFCNNCGAKIETN